MQEVLKKCNPNRHGWVKLIKWHDEDGDHTYTVRTPDDEDGTEFDGDLKAAEMFYDEEVKRYSELPNWDAQARYDDEHGTINGYAPWQFEREY